MMRGSFILCLVGVLIPLSAGCGSGCDYGCVGYGPQFTAVLRDLHSLPTNVRFSSLNSGYWTPEAQIEFVAEDGSSVIATPRELSLSGSQREGSPADLARVVTYVPETELLPDTTYCTQVQGFGDGQEWCFQTGAGPDRTPPQLSGLETRPEELRLSNPCSRKKRDAIELITAVPNAWLVVSRVEEVAAFDPTPGTGSVTVAGHGSVIFGSHVCAYSSAAGEPGVTAAYQAGLLDLAGNFSGWSEPFEITYPE